MTSIGIPELGTEIEALPTAAVEQLLAARDNWNEVFGHTAEFDGYEIVGRIETEDHLAGVVAFNATSPLPMGIVGTPESVHLYRCDEREANVEDGKWYENAVRERTKLGDAIVALHWHSDRIGDFKTLCTCGEAGIGYDPILANVALVERSGLMPRSSNTDCEWIKVGWVWQKPPNYSRGEVKACVMVDCEEGKAVRCRVSRIAHMQLGDADVAIYKEPPELTPDARNCCVTKCAWGITTGAITVDVEVESEVLKVKFSGSLGSVAEGGRSLVDCCGGAAASDAATPQLIALPDPPSAGTTGGSGAPGGSGTSGGSGSGAGTTITLPDGTTIVTSGPTTVTSGGTTVTTGGVTPPTRPPEPMTEAPRDCFVAPERLWMTVQDGPEKGRALVVLEATVNGQSVGATRKSIPLDDNGDGANHIRAQIGNITLPGQCDRPIQVRVKATVTLYNHLGNQVQRISGDFPTNNSLTITKCGDPRSRPTTITGELALIDNGKFKFLSDTPSRCLAPGGGQQGTAGGAATGGAGVTNHCCRTALGLQPPTIDLSNFEHHPSQRHPGGTMRFSHPCGLQSVTVDLASRQADGTSHFTRAVNWTFEDEVVTTTSSETILRDQPEWLLVIVATSRCGTTRRAFVSRAGKFLSPP